MRKRPSLDWPRCGRTVAGALFIPQTAAEPTWFCSSVRVLGLLHSLKLSNAALAALLLYLCSLKYLSLVHQLQDTGQLWFQHASECKHVMKHWCNKKNKTNTAKVSAQPIPRPFLTSTVMKLASWRCRFIMTKRPRRSLLLEPKWGNSQPKKASLNETESERGDADIRMQESKNKRVTTLMLMTVPYDSPLCSHR